MDANNITEYASKPNDLPMCPLCGSKAHIDTSSQTVRCSSMMCTVSETHFTPKEWNLLPRRAAILKEVREAWEDACDTDSFKKCVTKFDYLLDALEDKK